MWEQLIFDNASEILTASISLLIAYFKRKYDLRKLRKSGKLLD